MNDYAQRANEEETRRTLRAMCEASRGRQLRLIRAETDSGRSDGLLNTLTLVANPPRDFTSSTPVAVYVAHDVPESRLYMYMYVYRWKRVSSRDLRVFLSSSRLCARHILDNNVVPSTSSYTRHVAQCPN